MRLGDDEARRRFAPARVARLATVDDGGRPHLVPVTFAASYDAIVTAVDAKPKRSRDLKRLRNIRANPRVALLVDHYTDDWRALWWVRADGHARVVADAAEWAEPLRLLADKYTQYRDGAPDGPVIEISVERWVGWTAS
ncbi:MAG: TIGR03668 family PPOX class F420-dependent oxidoreductase [Streptosporangiaceae bacterium]